jgi:hypothetical protein
MTGSEAPRSSALDKNRSLFAFFALLSIGLFANPVSLKIQNSPLGFPFHSDKIFCLRYVFALCQAGDPTPPRISRRANES